MTKFLGVYWEWTWVCQWTYVNTHLDLLAVDLSTFLTEYELTYNRQGYDRNVRIAFVVLGLGFQIDISGPLIPRGAR